jgi:hypothetical protein
MSATCRESVGENRGSAEPISGIVDGAAAHTSRHADARSTMYRRSFVYANLIENITNAFAYALGTAPRTAPGTS